MNISSEWEVCEYIVEIMYTFNKQEEDKDTWLSNIMK